MASRPRSGSILPSPIAMTSFSQLCAASWAWNVITWTSLPLAKEEMPVRVNSTNPPPDASPDSGASGKA